MKRTQPYTMAAVVLAMALTAGPATADERVPVERLLPPNVFGLVTVPDCQELAARWERTQLGRLRDDPDLADFWREFDDQWGQWSQESERQLGVKLDELLAIPSGEVALALMQPPGQKMSLVGFLDFGDSDDTVETVLGRITQRLEQRDAQRSSREFEGTRIVTYTLPAEEAARDDDEDEPQQPADRKFSYFLRDSWLVVAGEPRALEAVLVRWDGRHARTFADNQTYRYVVERTRTREKDAALHWYVDPIGLLRAAVAAQAGDGNVQLQIGLGFLPVLGFDRLKGIGGSLDLATEEFDSISQTLIYVEQPTTGLLDAFRMPAAELAPPRWVPATASTYYGLNWDAAGAYDAVERLVDLFQGQGAFARIIDNIAGGEDGPQIHLRKDVIDQLTGRLHVFYQPAAEPAAATDDDEQPGEPYVLALGLKRGDRMQAVLAEIARADGFPGRAREFRGQTLYEISTGGLVQNTADTVGLAVVNDHLMVATDVTLLEQVLRDERDRRPLAEAPEYRRLARFFPARTSMIGYQHEDSQLRSAYELLRQGTVTEAMGIDFGKLPPFEAIQKYFPPTGSYTIPDERGALFVNFSLRNGEK